MKALAIFVVALSTVSTYAQTSINHYKYVIVPEKYEFSRSEDQYSLNTLTKLLLEDKGFATFMSAEQLPPQVQANKCNALRAEVVEKKGLFVTNLTLLLKDCQGNIVFKSKEGKSREKEFLPAYTEALRLAFVSLEKEPYTYDSTALAQQSPAVTTTPTTAAAPAPAPVAVSTAPAAATAPLATVSGTLYAQAITNGFQLIDTTPKKVLTMLKTSIADHYITGEGFPNGIVFKKGEEWVLEYYKDSQLVSQKLQIKF